MRDYQLGSLRTEKFMDKIENSLNKQTHWNIQVLSLDWSSLIKLLHVSMKLTVTTAR